MSDASTRNGSTIPQEFNERIHGTSAMTPRDHAIPLLQLALIIAIYMMSSTLRDNAYSVGSFICSLDLFLFKALFVIIIAAVVTRLVLKSFFWLNDYPSGRRRGFCYRWLPDLPIIGYCIAVLLIFSPVVYVLFIIIFIPAYYILNFLLSVSYTSLAAVLIIGLFVLQQIRPGSLYMFRERLLRLQRLCLSTLHSQGISYTFFRGPSAPAVNHTVAIALEE